MKRKGILGGIIVVVLILVLTLAVGGGSVSAEEPTIIASGSCGKAGSNVTWTLDSTGLLTISGEGEMEDYTYSYDDASSKYITNAPWRKRQVKSATVQDGVASIGGYAFYGCTGLTGVTIPDSVTNIGNYAFENCTGLTGVTIGNSVTSIGDYAFNGCTGLTEILYNAKAAADLALGSDVFRNAGSSSGGLRVIIGDGVRKIPSCLFSGCTGLTGMTIGNSVTSIGNDAFENCTGLTSVTIPNSVTNIGRSAFSGCTGLTSVTIPDSVTNIGRSAFSDCTGLTEIYYNAKSVEGSSSAFDGAGTSSGGIRAVIGDSVELIPAYLFSDCTGLSSVTIPDSVTSIGGGAFYGCTGLTSMTIPDSVTSMGVRAFSGCTGLTSVTIPDSVTSIGSEAFSGCSNLTSVYFNAKECADFKEDSNVFRNAGKNTEGMTITFGKNVKNIPSYLCYASECGYAPKVKKIYYNAKSVADLEIDNRIFGDAGAASGGLQVVIGDGVEKIPSCLFSGCTGLTSVTISNSVTSIGDYAFYNCTGLTSVEIPNSVTSIGEYAFYACTGLKSVTIGNSVTSIGEYAFNACPGLTEIIYNAKSAENLDISFFVFSKAGTSSDGLRVVIGDSVELIPAYLFANCTGLKSVTIGNSVTSIGAGAFHNCTGLTSVDIPHSVTSIGSNAFYDCTGLTSVTIPDSVASIGGGAFYGCTGLTSVTISNSVTSIGDYAFYNCTGLTSVEIPNSVTSIGKCAFYNCTGLTSVTIPDSVTSIVGRAFSGCTDLTSVTIGTGVVSIGEEAFGNCEAMTELKYNAKAAVDVSANAFASTGVDSDGIDVTFGKSVKKLPSYLFPEGKYISGTGTLNINIRSITFTGDAPIIDSSDSSVATFGYLNVCAFYPYQNETWTAAAREHCSEYLNWTAYTDAPVTDISCKIGTTVYLQDSPLDTGSISMTLTHEDGCVETIPYNSRLLELGSYDMSTPGEKVIDVTYKGYTAQMKIYVYVHEKKTETLDKEGYPESSHDYENNLDKTYTYCAKGADSLEVTFSAQTEVETNIDYLYVNGTKYTGTELAGKTLTISGDTLTIRLVSDKSDSAYGFSIDSIVKTYTVHEYKDTVVPPTCTEQGYTLRSCPCGSVVKQNYVPALGHDMVTDAAVAPTCTKTGLTEGSHCSRCDETIVEQKVVPALGHDMVTDAAVAPTCMKTGLTEGSHCSRCDEATTAQKVVPALGHDMVTDAAVAPTCTKTGLTEGSHCSRCDEATTAQKVVPALGHDMVTDAAVAPTCTKTGLTEGSHCARCDEATTAQKVVPALGHDMVTDAAVAPTCTKTGLTEGSHCSRCDDQTTVQEVIPARGHRFNARHICMVCGVEDPVVEITLKKLPTKASYVVNKEALDVAGGVVLSHYESGETEELELTAAMVSGFDNTILGKQTLTVTVGGLTTTFEVEVVERTVTSVAVENGKLVKHYTDGTTEETPLKDGAISDFAISETGEKTLTLTSENACVAAYKDADGNYVALKAVANEDGSYSYVVPEEVTEVTVAVKGDLDGDGRINMKDLAQLRRNMAEGTVEGGLEQLLIDFNGDGVVNMKDMGILRRYLAGGYDIELGW